MGGVLKLDSEPGEGTSISFSLPRLAAETAPASHGKRAASA
jgi:signal transduction histidine kinase